MAKEEYAKRYAYMKAKGYKDQRAWEKRNTQALTIKLHKEYEADVLEFWQSLDNKRQWFIDACRREMTGKE